jgi:hypothetical protein
MVSQSLLSSNGTKNHRAFRSRKVGTGCCAHVWLKAVQRRSLVQELKDCTTLSSMSLRSRFHGIVESPWDFRDPLSARVFCVGLGANSDRLSHFRLALSFLLPVLSAERMDSSEESQVLSHEIECGPTNQGQASRLWS